MRRTRIIGFPRSRFQEVLPYCARCLVRLWLPDHASITEVAGFSRFLRPGGPRILRSILCRLKITGFLDSLGNDFRNMLAYSAFLLDRGYTRTRQSTELFLHFTHFLHEDGLGDSSCSLSCCLPLRALAPDGASSRQLSS